MPTTMNDTTTTNIVETTAKLVITIRYSEENYPNVVDCEERLLIADANTPSDKLYDEIAQYLAARSANRKWEYIPKSLKLGQILPLGVKVLPYG